ncbi:DUF4255 domain-containing protein [Pseudotenacibaculum haliotis]|uniref:DUF4255 domain-containing protein n=1 Tax=Pseudotenacibaculum haliotis TaxID=1862138 RepID=A0ABW5LUC4_9FLAO
MIFEILQVITEEVNGYFGSTAVSLENIANVDQDGDSDSQGVFLTLLNMKEEYTLKNRTNHQITGTTVHYKNPKVSLNLYALFSANNTSYKESLKSISKIIQFFQGKRIFTQDNTNFLREGDMLNVKNFKFIADLFTPSFEELNFIWGTLGGKQYPSVIYKISLVEIERDAVLRQGEVITGLGSNFNGN